MESTTPGGPDMNIQREVIVYLRVEIVWSCKSHWGCQWPHWNYIVVRYSSFHSPYSTYKQWITNHEKSFTANLLSTEQVQLPQMVCHNYTITFYPHTHKLICKLVQQSCFVSPDITQVLTRNWSRNWSNLHVHKPLASHSRHITDFRTVRLRFNMYGDTLTLDMLSVAVPRV